MAFLALGLLSASGPYLYNPSYVKFALAAPGSVVWTLEPPPYPSRIELSSVAYRVDSEQVPLGRLLAGAQSRRRGPRRGGRRGLD